MDENKIIDLYWERCESAITETSRNTASKVNSILFWTRNELKKYLEKEGIIL